MTHRRESFLILRGLALLVPGAFGWLIHQGAVYLVQHSEVEIRLNHAGFDFLSYAAEMVFFLGAAGSIAAGLFFGLLGSLVYLRELGSFLKATAVNFFAAVILLCCAGTWILLPLALLLWVAAMIWVSLRPVDKPQPCASSNGGPGGLLGNSGVAEGASSVS